MIPTFSFFFGAIIGSFLNVLVIRSETEETLLGRSKCPRCQNMIAWYDNVPLLSYLVLGGRCRFCRESISWQYPLVELVTGGLFALFSTVLFRESMGVSALLTIAWFIFLISLLVALATYDIRTMELPILWIGIGIAGVVLYDIALATVTKAPWLVLHSPLVVSLLGSLGLAGFFWAIVSLSHETWMGMGDVWLAAFVGACIGFSSILLTVTLSFTLGALVSIVLLLSKKKGMKSQVPFAPFLAGGTLITLFLQITTPSWLTLFLLPFPV